MSSNEMIPNNAMEAVAVSSTGGGHRGSMSSSDIALLFLIYPLFHPVTGIPAVVSIVIGGCVAIIYTSLVGGKMIRQNDSFTKILFQRVQGEIIKYSSPYVFIFVKNPQKN